MIGLGTIVNAAAIVVGGFFGIAARRFLKERFQETITKAIGFAVIVLGLGSTLSEMLTVNIQGTGDQIYGSLDTQGVIMMIVSLVGGAFLGELINLDGWFERFGAWLRDKTGNSGDSEFINAFVTSSLTVCVGAMAILGSIQDGISGNHETLFAKALLDLLIVMMMAASLGKGCVFSALPVLVFQGLITILARFIAPVMTETAISNLSMVGNVLILCVGVNLVSPKTIRVANVLPAIVLAVGFALV